MNGRTIRTALVTAAFLATVVAMTVSVTGRGESYPAVDICETATWPLIPARCLDGSDRNVRAVAMMADARRQVTQAQIETEPTTVAHSGKGDLLRRPAAPSAAYAIVETRGDGISVLRRVPVETQH